MKENLTFPKGKYMKNVECKKVSVIVPVYKVEDVLTRCLDSLCRQSLQDIEIILVDDASPDRCGAICEEYVAKDERFTVIHHSENRGLSVARNTGIVHASAEYLMFVDSDDWLHEDFCRIPYDYAVQYQVDLVLFLYQFYGKNGSERPMKNTESRGFGKLSRMEALELMMHEVGNYAWNKLYRKSLFSNISYPEGYYYEDIGTTYKFFLLADGIYFLNKVLYFRCFYNGSITTLKTEKLLLDQFEMFIQQYRDLSAWGYPKDKMLPLLNNIVLNYCMKKSHDTNDDKYVFCRKVLHSTKTIPKDLTWRRKVLFVLLKYCPPLFDTVCVMCGKRLWF